MHRLGALGLLTTLLFARPTLAGPDTSVVADVQAGVDQVLRQIDAARFDDAHRDALALVERAKRLPDRHPVRLKADIALGSTLWTLARFDEAEAVYLTVFERTQEPQDLDELLVLIEVCSHLGQTRDALNDLPDAMEWHQTAWMLLTQNEVYWPVRFDVADRYASTAEKLSNHELSITLRTWVVDSKAQELGDDHLHVAIARLQLARSVLAGTSDAQRALALYDRALEVLTASDDPGLVAIAQMHRTEALLALGRVGDARTAIDAAWPGLEAMYEGNPAELVLALAIRGGVLHAEGRYAESLAASERVRDLRIAVLGPEHAIVGGAHLDVATGLLELARFQDSLAAYDRAIAVLSASLGDRHPDVALARMMRTNTQMEMGDYAAAEAALNEVLPILQSDAGSAWLVPSARLTLARIHDLRGEASESARLYEQALDEARTALGSDHPELAKLHNAYGVQLLGARKLLHAEAQFRTALRLIEASVGLDHPNATDTLNNLAMAYLQRGDAVRGQQLLEHALQITSSTYGEDHYQTASLHASLAVHHLDRGDYETAGALLERSVAIQARTLGDTHPSIAMELDKLATVTALRGDLETAEATGRRSLAIREAGLGPTHPDVSFSLEHLAQVLMWAERYDEARNLVERSLDITRNAFGPQSEVYRTAEAHGTLAELNALFGDVDGARDAYRTALARLPPSAAAPARLHLRRQTALYASVAGDREQARTELDAVFAAESTRITPLLGTLSDRERMAAVRNHGNTMQSLLLAHGGGGGDDARAYDAVLHFKGLVNRSLAVEQPARLAQRAPEDYARWRALKERLSDAALEGGDPAQLVELSVEKEAVRRRLAAANADAREELEKLHAADVCAAVPDDSALVDLVRRSEWNAETGGWYPVYTAFVMQAGCTAPERIELGPALPIETAIERYRSLLSSRAPTSRVDRAGKSVRTLLWDPLELPVDGAGTVYVVPDGAIATVPWTALPSAGGYLVDDRTFRVLDVASDLTPRAIPAEGPALVVGGVDYGPTEAVASTRAGCVSDFPALAGTASETAAIAAQLAKTHDVQRLTGTDATQATVVEVATDASLIHLATHGYFATGECKSALAEGASDTVVGMNPMVLSGVALANANTDRSGIWTAEEIASLPLNGVDLVVLSACETGLGEIRDGQGVLGLQRAFALSGARAVVMSLWPVDDEATARLMESFYGALLADPARDELQALHHAQRAILAENLETFGEARPETWAAFVVAGSPRAAP